MRLDQPRQPGKAVSERRISQGAPIKMPNEDVNVSGFSHASPERREELCCRQIEAQSSAGQGSEENIPPAHISFCSAPLQTKR